MSLRTVALDTPRPRERAIVCDPTGWAVVMCSSTMARRIAALRSSSSIGTRFYRVPAAAVGCSSAAEEARRDLVAEQPAPAREDDAVAGPGQQPDVGELVDARGHRRRIGRGGPELDPARGAQREHHGLGPAGVGRRGSRSRPRASVPAATAAM